jgi:glycosyltransferase involved in cell wall biosynthesis
VIVVGDGTGLPRLRELAGSLLNKRIFLPGRVPRDQVPDYLAAMDIGSLPQSVDRVGSFRYTTKLSEYLAMRLPFVTTQIPLAYDLDNGGFWRLPGSSPWDPDFIAALARLMTVVDMSAIKQKRAALTAATLHEFDRKLQTARVTEFLRDIGARP